MNVDISDEIINLEKSSIIFGSKVFEDTRMYLQQILQITNVRIENKYLGFPRTM